MIDLRDEFDRMDFGEHRSDKRRGWVMSEDRFERYNSWVNQQLLGDGDDNG